MATGRRTSQAEANYKLNPENMKIKAIEASEYANQACKETPMDKQGNSKSYKKCNKKSATS